MNESAPARRVAPGYLPAIDGLRAVACLSVLFFHCWLDGGEYDPFAWRIGHFRLSITEDISRFGFFGVDIFFVLSAFCLSYPLFRKKDVPFVWRDYLARRVRRIAPPYYAAFALFLTVSFLYTHFRIEPFYTADNLPLPSIGQLVLGLLFVHGYVNSSFWTLCVEVRWYLILPLFLVLLRRVKLPAFLLICLLFAAAGSVIDDMVERAKWAMWAEFVLAGVPSYLFTFGLGIAAALFATSEQYARVAPFLGRYSRYGLLLCVILVERMHPSWSSHPSRAALGAALAFFAVTGALYDPAIRRVLSWKPMVSIGIASYSIYLVHEPFLQLSYAYIRGLGWSPAHKFLVYQCVLGPLLVLLGLVFFALIEKPFSMTVRKGIAPSGKETAPPLPAAATELSP